MTPETEPAPPARRSRTPVLAIAAAVVVTAAGGACAAASGAGTTSTAPGAAGRTATPSTSARTGGDVTNIAQDTEVAPLKRVVVPDALAIAGTSVTAGQLARIRKIKQVKDVIAVDAGAIQLQNHRVNAFAVDPSAFRSWTPPATAKSENLWAALAADRFVVASADAQTLALKLGTGYSLVGRSVQTVTMGASGPLGIPGINLLVSRTTGGKLDLIPSLAVLVNAPSADPAKLGPQLKKIIGSGTSVLDLHAKKYTGTTSGTNYLDLYKQAAAQYCPGLSWTVLAAIGQIESDHGRNAGPSSAGALGPMQFMPATWKAYGVDGDHDGKADITNPYDAVPAAAHYLCANGAAGGGKRLYNAIFHYNHADWYVQEVLSLAQAYGRRYG